MAWPSASARSKNWGTETLTDADLEGQLDILHDYLNDALDASTGHKHDGTTSEGPKILTANIDDSAGTAGDVVYSTGSALTRLAIGTAAQVLKVNSGATAPEWGSVDTTVIQSYNIDTATSSQTTTSTSYVDLDSMTHTFTPDSANNIILIVYSVDTSHASQGSKTSVILDIGGNISGTERSHTAGANDGFGTTSAFHITTLAASSQTVKLQWKTSAGTGKCTNRQLLVIEFKV